MQHFKWQNITLDKYLDVLILFNSLDAIIPYKMELMLEEETLLTEWISAFLLVYENVMLYGYIRIENIILYMMLYNILYLKSYIRVK